MNRNAGTSKDAADKLVENIRRKRAAYMPEEKIRIVLAGLRGESIAAAARGSARACITPVKGVSGSWQATPGG